MEVKRKAIYKPSHKGFIAHGGKVIAFKDTKQINSFKRRYFNLYSALRIPDGCLYSRGIVMSEKTIPFEFIPSSELKARDAFWLEYFKNGRQFTEGSNEPYADRYPYISLD